MSTSMIVIANAADLYRATRRGSALVCVLWTTGAAMGVACGEQAKIAATASGAAAAPTNVRFDVRELRPTEQSLNERFEAARLQAVQEHKIVAVLFAADWCKACQAVDLDLGSVHPVQDIGHVRIFQLKEEAWEQAGRIDEFNGLRERWTGELFTYPMLVILDDHGKKRDDMNQAKERLAAQGVEPTFPRWFRGLVDAGPTSAVK